MSLAGRVQINIQDVAHFGPRVLARHLGRLRQDRMTTVPVPNVGHFHIRAGESDMAAVRQTFIERQYDLSFPPQLRDRIQRRYNEIVASDRTPIIVDAGANIGTAAVWFARKFPEAAIGAVEPEPGNFSVLQRNTEHYHNIVPIEAAIGGSPGHVAVAPVDLGWSTRTERMSEGVQVITIDQVCEKTAGDELFLVKIDVEGFESDLFSGDRRWIEKAYAIFIEPHDWMLPGEMTSRSFQEALGNHPFEIFIRGENLLYARV